ncbi:phage tail tape measure protein [Mycobacterium lentiflavum]|uniref:phage tail tape measure protein n=1 Tax=Mycobacterium lentiflavum TaxID=141349 RepID=UPI000B81223D|nr:phage tail tape measure protein [Mycobacterium lentiflavum]
MFLDVESRLDRRAVEATARELRTLFSGLGGNISRDLTSSLGKAFGAFDTTAARAELGRLETAWRRAADVEADSARRMEVAAAKAAAATERYGADSARAMQAQAVAARSQREFTDALVANEAAHQAHTRALQDSAAAATVAGRAWNAVGIGSLAVFTGSVLEATKAAGDFQQTQTKLVTSAGETTANLKIVSDGLLQMAGQVGYSAQELSKGMYIVESGGYHGAEGLKVMQAAAQGAKAEQSDLTTVNNALTTSLHDFKFGADQAADVMSKLIAAVSMGKTNIQDFSGAMHSVEPVAAAIGSSQNLNTQQMQHLMADVYGIGAQMTQTGMSADQSMQLMGHAFQKMLNPTQQMRDMLGALGIDSQELSAHLGERGLAGTLQVVQQAIQQHTQNGKVNLDVMYQSQQTARAEAAAFNALPGPARAVAQEIKDGTLSYKEFRKSRGGLSVEMANEVGQWNALNNKLTGFSSLIKSGIGNQLDFDQALKLSTGDQETFQIAVQTTGDNAAKTNEKIRLIDQTVREHDGTVKGFNETQETLNAKMADAKAAFGAAAIEIGSAFVPFMTSAANVAKDVGDAMEKHPAIMHAVVDGLGAVGAAWASIKLMNIVGTLAGITTGLSSMTAAENAAAVSAGGLKGALAGIAGAAGPVIGSVVAADTFSKQAEDSSNPVMHFLGDTFRHNPLSAYGIFNMITDRKADGGPVHGRGPNGIDSVHAILAPGEHVLTHHDVSAMGGHAGVYAFRQSLHGGLAVRRQYGGAIGPDVQVAHGMVGTGYSQAARNDCSGMVGRVVLGALGIPGAGGLPTTKNMGPWLAALGFKPGIGGPGAISVGWYDHGGGPNDGHAAMTLSDGENAESGGSHGNFLVGPGAAGAASSQFDHHMFLPNLYGEGPGGGMPGGFGGAGGMGGGGMGGGIPAGARAGTGPGGQQGYYTANPEKVASAEERLRHIDEEIRIAEERKANLKADASQAEKDRLNEELRHLHAERDQEQVRLQRAQQGTFHASGAGGRGMGGSPFLPVPLADKFGLDKGLGGVVEWGIGALEDMVLGPLETAAWAALGNSMGAGMGMPPGPGDAGFGAPRVIPADLAANIGPEGGGGPSGSPAPSSSSGSPGKGAETWWGGWHPSKPGPTAPAAPGMGPMVPDWARPYGIQGPMSGFGLTAPGGPHPALPGNGMIPASPNWQDMLVPGSGTPSSAVPGSRATGPLIMPGYTGGAPWIPGFTPGFAAGGLSTDWPGGPKGTDTIPAWLSPGEFVMNSNATSSFLPQLQAMNMAGRFGAGGLVPQYWAPGTDQPVQPGQGQLPNTQNPGTQKPQGSDKPALQAMLPGGQKQADAQPGPPGPPPGPSPAGLGAASAGQAKGLEGLATPGADTQSPGQNLPPSPGIGFSGGIIGGVEGAAEGAASAAGDMFAPGSGAAASAVMSIGFQELNRAAAYGAQAGGILAQGVLETFIPTSSAAGGDFSETIPGRLLSGIAGARPASPNTAGQTKQPNPGDQQGGYTSTSGQAGGGGFPGDYYHNQFHGPVTIQANSPRELYDSLSEHNGLWPAEGVYPSAGNFPGTGSRS